MEIDQHYLLARSYLSELSERAVRMHLHLEVTQDEFFSGERFSLGEQPTKFSLLQSYKDYVGTIVEMCIRTDLGLALRTIKPDKAITLIGEGFECLNSLHERGLTHLPRPAEPVELRRFCRIITKHILSPTGVSTNIAVYNTEQLSDSALVAGPVAELTEMVLAPFVMSANRLLETNIASLDIAGEASSHVTIARVDSRNPCRWPTLVHEVAHKILTADLFPLNDIEDGFRADQNSQALLCISHVGIHLRAWLIEIWCDLFGALAMGPAFFFSQYAALLQPQTGPGIASSHPPACFRLRMVRQLLWHRYPALMESASLTEEISRATQLIELLDGAAGRQLNDPYLRQIFQAMWSYFQRHFFGSRASGGGLTEKLSKMIAHVRDLTTEQLDTLVGQLDSGLPIPSKNSAAPNGGGVEEPTSVQEILLAGWIHRQRTLTPKLRGEFARFTTAKNLASVLHPISCSIQRFDQALLRSIQVGEWLHLYGAKQSAEVASISSAYGPVAPAPVGGMLVDHQIEALLAVGQLRIIPYLNIGRPLGASSLDLRLGTSFQVYFPRWRRSQADRSISGSVGDSKLLDLDFLEHVVLLPGQFVLAHSLEYIRLPENLGAEVDGRSTYARLGLEVHMTAGFIDPGFEGVVTFELFNGGPNPIALFPGYRVAQLRFYSVSSPRRPYSRNETAKYRGLLQHNQSLYAKDPEAKVISDALGNATGSL